MTVALGILGLDIQVLLDSAYQEHKIRHQLPALNKYHEDRTIHQCICCPLYRILLSMPMALGILGLDIQVLPDSAHQEHKIRHLPFPFLPPLLARGGP